jgi:hypothetical protein
MFLRIFLYPSEGMFKLTDVNTSGPSILMQVLSQISKVVLGIFWSLKFSPERSYFISIFFYLLLLDHLFGDGFTPSELFSFFEFIDIFLSHVSRLLLLLNLGILLQPRSEVLDRFGGLLLHRLSESLRKHQTYVLLG